MRGGGRGGKPSIFKDRGMNLADIKEQLQQNQNEPPPLFPHIDTPAIPMPANALQFAVTNYRKNSIRWFQRHSPFHLRTTLKSIDIERYSDKYKNDTTSGIQDKSSQLQALIMEQCKGIVADELLVDAKTMRKLRRLQAQDAMAKTDVLSYLDKVAAHADKLASSAPTKATAINKGDEDEDQIVPDEEYDEEIDEEENDYAMSYFDNGEGEESEGEEEAVY